MSFGDYLDNKNISFTIYKILPIYNTYVDTIYS